MTRALIRLRTRGRVRLARGVRVGRRVRFHAGAGGRIEVGPGVRIGRSSRLRAEGGVLRIGAEAEIGERCLLLATEQVEIGAGCVLADDCAVFDEELGYSQADLPIRAQAPSRKPVRLGDGACMGPGAVLGPGADVGPGATVSARAVVKGPVPAGGLAAGVPVQV